MKYANPVSQNPRPPVSDKPWPILVVMNTHAFICDLIWWQCPLVNTIHLVSLWFMGIILCILILYNLRWRKKINELIIDFKECSSDILDRALFGPYWGLVKIIRAEKEKQEKEKNCKGQFRFGLACVLVVILPCFKLLSITRQLLEPWTGLMATGFTGCMTWLCRTGRVYAWRVG